jgi:rubrerythrin
MTTTGNGHTQEPISDLEYDFITVLQNKAEAVKAYEIYIQDAQEANSQPCVELFQKLRQSEIQQAQEVRHHLQQVMQQGRM